VKTFLALLALTALSLTACAGDPSKAPPVWEIVRPAPTTTFEPPTTTTTPTTTTITTTRPVVRQQINWDREISPGLTLGESADCYGLPIESQVQECLRRARSN
jgi:hypothetical protein